MGPSPGTPFNLPELAEPPESQDSPLRDAWKEFLGKNNKFFKFQKLQFFSYKSLSILNRQFLGNDLLEIFNSMFKSINHNRPNTQLIDTSK